MNLSRKVAVVATTFLLAAATGQYMQGKLPLLQPAAPKPRPAAHSAAVAKPAQPTAAPALQQAASAELPSQVTPLAAHVGASGDGLRHAMPQLTPLPPALPAALTTASATVPGAPAPQASACHDEASVAVDTGAMLDFSLDAPCHPSQRVVIRHAGLAFTEITDARGHLSVTLPAMQEAATVTAMFAGGVTVSAAIEVPELSVYDRVVVQWMGKDSFDLHALEFGADFGDAGDISAQNLGSAAPQAQATEGFMTTLGNGDVPLPMRAQVYTYPSRLSAQDGDVRLVVDADVSPDTCGREMLAETLRTRDNAAPSATDLSVAMPDCGQPGGFVQLSGLLPDIKVAGN